MTFQNRKAFICVHCTAKNVIIQLPNVPKKVLLVIFFVETVQSVESVNKECVQTILMVRKNYEILSEQTLYTFCKVHQALLKLL